MRFSCFESLRSFHIDGSVSIFADDIFCMTHFWLTNKSP